EFKSAIPALSNDIELLPGISLKWGLSFLINAQQLPTGRSPGSLAWAGLANTHFWIDRTRRVSGVFLSQVFPFYDHTTIDLLGKFETEVYRALWPGLCVRDETKEPSSPRSVRKERCRDAFTHDDEEARWPQTVYRSSDSNSTSLWSPDSTSSTPAPTGARCCSRRSTASSASRRP